MQKLIKKNNKPNIGLVQFLKEEGIKFPLINKALRQKDIIVNGNRINKDITINEGDEVIIYLPNKKPMKIDKIYENDNLLIVNKPAGIETATKDAVEESLEDMFDNQYKAVHRLDRNTEGLVILAKNEKTEKVLIDCLKRGEIEKIYCAKVFGLLAFKQTDLKGFWEKDSKNKIVKIYKTPTRNSTEIFTNVRVIKKDEKFSLVEVKILSGKTHQIRAHLASIGNPIVGDLKYGNKKNNKKTDSKQMCLTACQLKFNIDKNCELFYLNDLKIYVNPSWTF